jgi:hypothetical protein
LTVDSETDWGELVAILTEKRQIWIDMENDMNVRGRVENWLVPAYDAFVTSQPPSACLPPLLDVCFMPEVVSALCSMPLDKPLPKELKEAVIALFPLYALEWKRERDQELLSIIRQASPYANRDVSVDALHYASTMFVCEACHKSITYPSVISHSCNFVSKLSVKVRAPGVKHPSVTKTRPSSTKLPVRIVEVENDLARNIGLAARLGRYCGAVIWGGFRQVVFDELRHEHMVNMLDALEWSRTTLLSEMEEKDPYVDCLCQCFFRMRGNWPRGKITLKWKEAVSFVNISLSLVSCNDNYLQIENCGQHRGKRSEAQFFAKSGFNEKKG